MRLKTLSHEFIIIIRRTVHKWSLQDQKSTCEITQKTHGMVHCICTSSQHPAEEVVHVAGHKSISYHRSGENERRSVCGRGRVATVREKSGNIVDIVKFS